MGYKLIYHTGGEDVARRLNGSAMWWWNSLLGDWRLPVHYNHTSRGLLYAIGDKPDFNPDSAVLVMRGGDNAMEVGKYREKVWAHRSSATGDFWNDPADGYFEGMGDRIYATKDCPLSPTEAHALISPECPVLDLAKIQALGHSEPVQYEERARVWRGQAIGNGYLHWWWEVSTKRWIRAEGYLHPGNIFVPVGGPEPALPPPPPDRILSVNSLEQLNAKAPKHIREQAEVWQKALDKSRNEEIRKELDTQYEVTVRRKRPNMIKQTAKAIAVQSAVNAIHDRAIEAASLGLQKAGIPKEVVEAPAFQVALSLALPLLVQGACEYRLLSSNGLPEGIESKLGYAASMATATTGVQLLSPVFSQIVAQVTPFLDQIELPEASGAVERIKEDE